MEYFVLSKLVPPKESNPILLKGFIRCKNEINMLYRGYFKEQNGENKQKIKDLELEKKLDACLKYEYAEKREHLKKIQEIKELSKNYRSQKAKIGAMAKKLDACLKYEYAEKRIHVKKIQEIEELSENYRSQKTKLWAKNIGLVIQLARRLSRGNGILEDLIQDGSEGVFISAKKYDPKKNTKFSTYATYWIRQCMQNAIRKYYKNPIIKPIDIEEHLAKLIKYYPIYSEKLNREKKRCSTDFDRITARDIKGCLKINDYNTLRIIAALKTSNISSLDELNEDGDFYLSEMIGDEDQIIDIMRNNIIEKCISSLSPREQDVIRLRYGNERCTLDRIGKIYEITRERIRQIENIALRKLKKNKRMEELGKEIGLIKEHGTN